jgi:hypothetical protein
MPYDNTRIAARIVGPLMIIVGAVIMARFADLALLIPAILGDGPLAFVTGIFTLICGLVLFAFHHRWSGLPAIIITVLALATIVRGVILMFAPNALSSVAAQALSAGPIMMIGGLIALILGAWLSFVGWFAKQGNP